MPGMDMEVEMIKWRMLWTEVELRGPLGTHEHVIVAADKVSIAGERASGTPQWKELRPGCLRIARY